MAGHIDWIDRWKGILIFLVVLAHAIGGGVHQMEDGSGRYALQVVWMAIYAFHMPSFFILAGLVWHEKNEGVMSFLSGKFRRLMVPYYVFGLFSILIFAIFSSGIGTALSETSTTSYYMKNASTSAGWPMQLLGLLHGGGWPDGEGLRMNSVLWFLPCMFVTIVFFKMLPKRNLSLGVAFAILIALLLARLFRGHYLPLGIGKVPAYLSYMILGYWAGKIKLPTYTFVSRAAQWCFTIFSSSLFITVVAFLMRPLSHETDWAMGVVCVALACWGSFISAQVARLVSFEILGALGRASLGIMLLHKFIVMGLELKVPWFYVFTRNGFVGGLVGSILVTGISILVSMTVSHFVRLRFPWALGEHG